MERKCKKEESAQRGVWGEVPETTHALKERDSRKDRVGKGGGGGSREGQKKVVPSREIPPNIAYRNIFLWRCLRERRWRSGRYISSPPLSRFSRGLECARGGDRTQAKRLAQAQQPFCTLSQNGYGEHLWASGRLDPPDPLGSARSCCRCQGARSTRGGAGLTGAAGRRSPLSLPAGVQASKHRQTLLSSFSSSSLSPPDEPQQPA